MKLTKLNTDYYIIVDNSEIKIGDWYYDFHNQEVCESTFNKLPIEFGNCKKITHSTRHKRMENVTFISPKEIKELIGEVDVEKKASEYAINDFDDYAFCGYISGYNQAIEDNKDKKWTDEDLRKTWNAAYIDAMSIDEETYKPLFFEDFIQSLQPKTEWEVEFVDGKLKLK